MFTKTVRNHHRTYVPAASYRKEEMLYSKWPVRRWLGFQLRVPSCLSIIAIALSRSDAEQTSKFINFINKSFSYFFEIWNPDHLRTGHFWTWGIFSPRYAWYQVEDDVKNADTLIESNPFADYDKAQMTAYQFGIQWIWERHHLSCSPLLMKKHSPLGDFPFFLYGVFCNKRAFLLRYTARNSSLDLFLVIIGDWARRILSGREHSGARK